MVRCAMCQSYTPRINTVQVIQYVHTFKMIADRRLDPPG